MKVNSSYKLANKNSGLFGCLLIMLFVLPWLRGGEVNWQYLIVTTLIFLVLGLSLLRAAVTKEMRLAFTQLKNVRVAIVILLLWLSFSFFQALEIPTKWVEILNPYVVNDHSNVKDLISLYTQQKPPALLTNDDLITLSVAPHITLFETVKNTSYVAFFIITLVLLNSHRRIYILATILFMTSLSIAFYATLNYYTKGEVFYLQPLAPWQGETYKTITGTFSYRNHYAAFLNLTIPLGIGLAYYATSKPKVHIRKRTKFVDFVLSKQMFFLFFSLFLFALLIFNSSRAGIGALFISLALTFSYLVAIKKIKIKLKSTIISCLTILLLLIFVVVSGLADPLMRKAQNFGDNGRAELRQTAVVIIKKHPLVGTGAGTYPAIQARFRSALLYGNKMWQHAHNDYFEFIITQGIVGFAVFATALFILVLLLMQGLRDQHSPMYFLQIACLWSCLTILIHSFVDFNFQLPVNTVYFWVILAIGIKINCLKQQILD